MENFNLTPRQEVIKSILVDRFHIPTGSLNLAELQELSQDSKPEQIRAFAFDIVSQFGTEKHPVRMMSEVSKTVTEFAEIIGIEIDEFPCNIGNVDLVKHPPPEVDFVTNPPSESEFADLPDLAVVFDTEAFEFLKIIRDTYFERWIEAYGSGYHDSGIFPETAQALEIFMERANLHLIRDEENIAFQSIKLSLGASEGLSIAFASVNKYFKDKTKSELSHTSDPSAVERLNARLSNKTIFIHPGPSFVATDSEASSYGNIHTLQLEPPMFEITDEYIEYIKRLISNTNDNCLIIEDTPNPLGRRLTNAEWQRIDRLMDEFPELVCVLDHAYVGLAQNEDLSSMVAFRKKYVDRIISIGSISKVGANPMERIGAVIYPTANPQNPNALGNAVESYISVLHPTLSINMEAYILAKLQIMLVGNNFYKRSLLLTFSKFKTGAKKLAHLRELLEPKDPSTKYIEEETSKLFRQRTQLLYNVLREQESQLDSPLFESIIEPQNTLYVFAKLPDGMSGLDLYLKTGIAAVPGECFGEAGKGWIRLSVGILSEDEIRKMGIVLSEAFNQTNEC